MIEVVISGASGRLGRRTVALCLAAPDLRVASLVVRPGSPFLGIDGGVLSGGEPSGVAAVADLLALTPSRVLIETATPKAAFAHAEQAFQVGAPMLIASTGFDKKQTEAIHGFAKETPVLLAPNLSLGITVLTDLVTRASKALKAYDLELVELHHNQKRDAPSGTAWALARAAATARGQDLQRDAIVARSGETGPRGVQEIGMQSVRGGDVIGEHTLYLMGETERLELTHRASSRDAFAAGAVAGARFLGEPGRKPGLYAMGDVLHLEEDQPSGAP